MPLNKQYTALLQDMDKGVSTRELRINIYNTIPELNNPWVVLPNIFNEYTSFSGPYHSKWKLFVINSNELSKCTFYSFPWHVRESKTLILDCESNNGKHLKYCITFEVGSLHTNVLQYYCCPNYSFVNECNVSTFSIPQCPTLFARTLILFISLPSVMHHGIE